MSKQETVEVTVNLPKGIVDFLRDMEKVVNMTVKEYLEYSIIQAISADLEGDFVFAAEPKQVVEKYNLRRALQEYNALPSDCKP